jgi:hypothetical protein
MKTTLKFVVLFFAIASFISSCKKDDDSSTVNTTQEVADDMASALGTDNSGISSEIVMATNLSASYSTKSLATKDTMYSYDTTYTASYEGTYISYDYTYTLEYGFVYSNLTLDNFYYNGLLSGWYNGTKLYYTDERTGNWVVTGLGSSSTSYIVNGTTTRTGATQSKVRNKSTLASTSSLTLTNVLVNKNTHKITGGTITWTITGTVNTTPYSYTATVTFTGSDQATLEINGTTYTIDLAAGEVK